MTREVKELAYREAVALANSLWSQHYREQSPHWRPLPDLRGVISQIDNMTAGLTRTPTNGAGAREISERARELLKSLPANWWLLDAFDQPLNGETRAALRAIESALSTRDGK